MSTARPDRAALGRRITEIVASRLRLDPADIDPAVDLASYGLDSVEGAAVALQLEEWLGLTLPETLVLDHPTIDALADFLAAPAGGGGGADGDATAYRARAAESLWVYGMPFDRIADAERGIGILERGEGVYVWDAEGRRYLDALSGIYSVGVGHGRRELVEAAAKQIAALAICNNLSFATRATIDLADQLIALAPEPMRKVHFVTSGSEATDVAIRLARQYHWNRGERRRYKIISRAGSYHGHTLGALSYTYSSSSLLAHPPQEPLMSGSIPVPTIDCYRCPYEKSYPECDVFCARILERFIQTERPETVAALIAEPISATGGGQVPPPEYWHVLRSICDAHGILLIADEVLTGFGRTGTWFGLEHFGVPADMITVAKGITSGYQPMGAVLVGEAVVDAFRGGPERLYIGGHTFGGHPVASAVALANLEVLERERLVENAASQGAYLHDRLRELATRRKTVAEVRGVGLLASLQLARDPATRRPFTKSDRVAERLGRAVRRRGVLLRAAERIDLAPPLCVRREEIDRIVEVLDESIAEVEDELAI